MTAIRRPRRGRWRLTGGIILTVAALAAPALATSSWNYTDKGPDTWAEDFPDCGGDEQTPIDIVDGTMVRSAPPGSPRIRLVVNYENRVDVEVFNNTHTVQANVPKGAGHIWSAGKRYELLQFHFHTPSEHDVNGESFPLEMHLVHQAADGQLAVVGVMLDEGLQNEILAPVWSDLPDVDETRSIDVADFKLRRMVPKRPQAVNYQGSLTTPPCSEEVNWFVTTDVQEMSGEQIDDFVEIFSGEDFPEGNSRPLLDRNDRTLQIVNGRPGPLPQVKG